MLDNRIAAVLVRSYASPAECAAFSRAARAGNMKFYSVAKRIGYIGMAQYEYRWNRPLYDYFGDVSKANADLSAVVANAGFDPVARMIDHLLEVWDVPAGIGREAGHGDYYASIVRMTPEGVDLHADFAPFNSPTYSNAHVDAQLGRNFFAEQLATGGDTTIHNAPWSPAVEPGTIPQSYNRPRGIVAGAPTFTYAPTAGDVVIFNTRNPHEIAGGTPEAGRDRISIGAFIGRMPDRSLVLWS